MIGVFDSGDGGLTVLKALVERLPRRRFCYLGDHANAPYGGRDPEEIYRLTQRAVDLLFAGGCRLVLLACNTASAVALRRLQQTWLPARDPSGRNLRVLGVLVPMVEAISKVPWHATTPPPDVDPEFSSVAVFATRRTVETGAYVLEVGKRAPHIEVVQQACPDLVSRIEADAPAAELTAMVEGYVAALLERMAGRIPDNAVLGCTHYPLVAGAFAAALPAGVRLLDQPTVVAESLTAYLQRHPDLDNQDDEGKGEHTNPLFLTTGHAGEVGTRASRFFGRPVRFEGVI